MNIFIRQLITGASEASGITVVIDVFRAFTTACYMMANGAKTVLPIDDISQARALRSQNPEFLLVGERNEKKPADFDFGNSPTHLENINLQGKTVLFTTSAGTQGIRAAQSATQVLTGSFVNAPAIARYILAQMPEEVTLVCMGKAAKEPIEEDTYCAEYIKSLLQDVPYPLEERLQALRMLDGKRFFIPENQTDCPSRDFTLATQVGKFDFVLRAVPWEQDVAIKKLVMQKVPPFPAPSRK